MRDGDGLTLGGEGPTIGEPHRKYCGGKIRRVEDVDKYFAPVIFMANKAGPFHLMTISYQDYENNPRYVYDFEFLIERGGGKVLGYVWILDLSQKPPKGIGPYILVDKEKLDKAMIEALSNPINYEPDPDPKTWYKIPDSWVNAK